MITPSPTRTRLSHVVDNARDRREQRLDRNTLRSEVAAFTTTSEIAELSAIAARNDRVDTGELRTLLARQLSR
jgi:hypothetical protein